MAGLLNRTDALEARADKAERFSKSQSEIVHAIEFRLYAADLRKTAERIFELEHLLRVAKDVCAVADDCIARQSDTLKLADELSAAAYKLIGHSDYDAGRFAVDYEDFSLLEGAMRKFDNAKARSSDEGNTEAKAGKAGSEKSKSE